MKPILFILFFAVGPTHAELAVGISSDTLDRQASIWNDWKREYPELIDYGGEPLRILSSISHGPMIENSDLVEKMGLVREKYPGTKLRPLIDYELAGSAKELTALIVKYPAAQFPRVADEFLDSWKHFPSGGMRVAGLAQREIAYGAYRYEYHNWHDDNGGDKKIGEREWAKVLKYYPDRFDPKNTITENEWGKVVEYAYFALLEIYDLTGQVDKAIAAENEILKLPNHNFGDNSGANAYAEVYLRKSARASKNREFTKAAEYLYKLIAEFGNESWGYHGGISEEYRKTALSYEGIPSTVQIKTLKRIVAAEGLQTELKNWATMALISILSYDRKGTEAEQYLNNIFLESPEYVVSTLEPYDPRRSIVIWDENDTNSKLKKTYYRLKFGYWKHRYPDSVDYDGRPLKMLLDNATNTDLYSGIVPSDILNTIKSRYPKTVLRPLIDFGLLGISEVDSSSQSLVAAKLSGFINSHKNDRFPSVCAEFSAICPIAEGRAGAAAQTMLAEVYEKAARNHMDDVHWEKVLAERKKVLEYYPKRFDPDNKDISQSEWREIIYPAYFKIMTAYEKLHKEDVAIAFADEIVTKGPQTNYRESRYADRKSAYSEAYLLKARLLATKKDYPGMEEALIKCVESALEGTQVYLDEGEWGYFFEIVKLSYYKAPPETTIGLIERIEKNTNIAKYTRPIAIVWADVIRVCLLYKLNKPNEAKRLLEELFQKDADTLAHVISGYQSGGRTPPSPLTEYFSYQTRTPLSEFYEQLKDSKFH